MGSGHFLCSVVALLALLAVRQSVSSPDDQCQFIFKEDSVLEVELSQKNGGKVRTDLHVADRFKCAEACCSSEGEWCTLAVFHTNTGPEQMNCFLVQCVPEGSQDNVCVTKHVRHSGFVTADVKHHIPSHEEPTTVKATTKTLTTATSKASIKVTSQAVVAETTPNPKWTSPAAVAANGTSDSNATQPTNASQTDQDRTKNPEEVKHSNINRTTVTQTGILIVTLCFGIIFLLAMMVVVGKRWCEGYQRRKYSKVDYLINGYYS